MASPAPPLIGRRWLRNSSRTAQLSAFTASPGRVARAANATRCWQIGCISSRRGRTCATSASDTVVLQSARFERSTGRRSIEISLVGSAGGRSSQAPRSTLGPNRQSAFTRRSHLSSPRSRCDWAYSWSGRAPAEWAGRSSCSHVRWSNPGPPFGLPSSKAAGKHWSSPWALVPEERR